VAGRALCAIQWRMQLNQRVLSEVRGLGRVRACLLACVVLLQFFVAWPVAAVNAAAKPDATATLRQNIESRFPGAHVLDVQPSAIPGVYEVYMGDQIVYSDALGDYLLVGSMVDTQTKQNLTDARMNEHGKIDFSALPVDRAIKIVKGNGSRKFAVFSDPDCPFCQQLEKTLLSVTDITMYVFLYPIASLHPQAPAKAHAIWCAADRQQAWNQWMQEKKLPPAKTCSGDPIDGLQKLGDTLHVNSTPTLFFANGRRVAGAIPAPELEKDLAAAGSPKASAATPKTSQAPK
jgi:thiol:disulfide interchange protein DsbC